jgi:hypothetical protein
MQRRKGSGSLSNGELKGPPYCPRSVDSLFLVAEVEQSVSLRPFRCCAQDGFVRAKRRNKTGAVQFAAFVGTPALADGSTCRPGFLPLPTQ